MDLGDLRFVAARPALERVFLEVANLSLSSKDLAITFSCNATTDALPNCLKHVLEAETAGKGKGKIGALTQQVSSTRRYHIYALGRHLTLRIVALSGMHLPRERSCNRAPSPRNGDHHPELDPLLAV